MINTLIIIYLLGIITAMLITTWDTYVLLQAQGYGISLGRVFLYICKDPHPNFLTSWYFVIERIILGS